MGRLTVATSPTTTMTTPGSKCSADAVRDLDGGTERYLYSFALVSSF
jgi:hypothetical protein